MTNNRKTGLFFSLLFILALLSACSSLSAKTTIEMEITKGNDTSGPLIYEKPFYMSNDIDFLELNVTFQMKGNEGTLEIVDNETKEVLWSNTWNKTVKHSNFKIPLISLKKDKGYTIKFTGTKISYVKAVITTEDGLVKEQAKPTKSNK